MIEMKELQALVICAEVHSITRAAEILYTTQPNVSKMIRHLETKLGFSIFYRDNRGIRLTQKGKKAYEYACRIIEEEEELSELLQMDSRDEFSVIANPSSWISRFLTLYYRTCRHENVRYCFMEGSVSDVMESVASGRCEIGLIYYQVKQQNGIDYQLQRRSLSFHELKELQMCLYHGAEASNTDMDDVRLIQCYDDEFAFSRNRQLPGRKDMAGKVEVITNSDYIMRLMLEETDLCNISPEDVGHASSFRYSSLEKEEGKILFGYVKRTNEELSKCAAEMLMLLRRQLK